MPRDWVVRRRVGVSMAGCGGCADVSDVVPSASVSGLDWSGMVWVLRLRRSSRSFLRVVLRQVCMHVCFAGSVE